MDESPARRGRVVGTPAAGRAGSAGREGLAAAAGAVGGAGPAGRSLAGRLLWRLEELASAMEKASVAEFIELYRSPARLLALNFLAGLARGFGIAVGFSTVGAVFLYLLGRLAALKLPVIGSFVAEVVRIVQTELGAPR